MSKKIVTLCSIVIALSLCLTVFSVGFKAEKNDVTTANMKTFYAEKNESTASGAMNAPSTTSRADKATGKIEAASNKVDGAIDKIEDASNKVDGAFDKLESASDKVDGVLGGLGDALGSTGDAPSDFLDGMDSDSLGDVGSGLGDALGGIGSGSSGGNGSGLGDALSGIGGGALGDIGSGLGDALSGIGGGASSGLGSGLGGIFEGAFGGSDTTVATTLPITTQNYNAGLIIPVPAATQVTTEAQTEAQADSTDDESKATGETIDYEATVNPYTKPTATFVAGDEDESIKWLQWIFVYTGYGLGDDGITGVLDEATVEVIKKLQKENKMTVDGNITEGVIKAAEELYYKVVLGGDINAIEVLSQATTGVNGSEGTVAVDNANGVPVILLVVILVIIWGLAIGGIVFLFILKKKKAALQKAEQAKPEEKKDASQTESKEIVTSISDLFEEAEKNNK